MNGDQEDVPALDDLADRRVRLVFLASLRLAARSRPFFWSSLLFLRLDRAVPAMDFLLDSLGLPPMTILPLLFYRIQVQVFRIFRVCVRKCNRRTS